jgi:hypothetical protein
MLALPLGQKPGQIFYHPLQSSVLSQEKARSHLQFSILVHTNFTYSPVCDILCCGTIRYTDRKDVRRSMSMPPVEVLFGSIVQSSAYQRFDCRRSAVVSSLFFTGLWTCSPLARHVDLPLCVSSHYKSEVCRQHHVQVAESAFAAPVITYL